MLIRLDKFLADCGEGTRKGVKELLKQGRITVNGVAVKKPDIKIDTENDTVKFDNKTLGYNEYEYYMLNKPGGVISAANDKKQKTVVDLIKDKKRRDLFPVGRLDKDTEGLMIITNDGILCNKLLAPGKHVEKKYFATVRGAVTKEDVEHFKKGVDIGDDKLTKEAFLSILNVYSKMWKMDDEEEEREIDFSDIEIILTEGRYHEIKRMFEAVGKEVVYLKRLSMGRLILDESLALGEYRTLTAEEIKLLSE